MIYWQQTNTKATPGTGVVSRLGGNKLLANKSEVTTFTGIPPETKEEEETKATDGLSRVRKVCPRKIDAND